MKHIIKILLIAATVFAAILFFDIASADDTPPGLICFQGTPDANGYANTYCMPPERAIEFGLITPSPTETPVPMTYPGVEPMYPGADVWQAYEGEPIPMPTVMVVTQGRRRGR